MIINGPQNTTGAASPPFFDNIIHNSMFFDRGDQTYLNRLNVSNPSDNTKWSFSTWMKRVGHVYAQGDAQEHALLYAEGDWQNYDTIQIAPTDVIEAKGYISNVLQYNIYRRGMLRDNNAWFHVYIEFDSNAGTVAERYEIFVNAETRNQQYLTNPPAVPNKINSASQTQLIGRKGMASSLYGSFYLAETIFADGIHMTLEKLGLFKGGIWIPRRYNGGFGNNGFHLKYEVDTNLGLDSSGNGNDFGLVNGSTANQTTDSPTNNHCTMPISIQQTDDTQVSTYKGDLRVWQESTNVWWVTHGGIGVKEGKYYWEMYMASSMSECRVGIIWEDVLINTTSFPLTYVGSSNRTYSYDADGTKWVSGVNTAYGASYGVTDTIGILLDCDNWEITFYKNNVSQGAIAITADQVYLPAVSLYQVSTYVDFNFGQKPFTYTPPAGSTTLSTSGLPKPAAAINPGLLAASVVFWQGNGSGGNRLAGGASFYPDWAIVKSRDGISNWLTGNDERTVGSDKMLFMNTDQPEVECGTQGYIYTLNVLGIGVDTGSSGDGDVNETNELYLAYLFKEGVNYGFSIIRHTGTGVNKSIAHGLGGVPEFCIHKRENDNSFWICYHKDAPTSVDPEKYIGRTDDTGDWLLANLWQDTAPTSSFFYVSDHPFVNNFNDPYINFYFRSIPNFSKVFFYEGNGDTTQNGPFIYCGFRPSIVLIKGVSNNGAVPKDWVLINGFAEQGNPVREAGHWNKTNPMTQGTHILDFLSNGFKIRYDEDEINESGVRFVGIAFADQPLNYAIAR